MGLLMATCCRLIGKMPVLIVARGWTVPARRMKANRKHRVLLGGRAMKIIEVARILGEGIGPRVFTRPSGKRNR